MSGGDATGDATGDLAADYHALRHGVGAFGLGRDVVAVRGPDAPSYLQGQLSQDMEPIGIGDSVPALLLEPDGKLCALVRATRTGTDAYVVDTDGGYGDRVAERLRRFRLRTKVEIELLDWPSVALRGPGTVRLAPGAPADHEGPWTVAVDWNGTRGVDRIGPGAAEGLPEEARWVGEPAWEALRVEAGIPAMGRELDERTIAAEAGLVARTVSFTKGCYTGQELVARLDARGSRVARRLVGIVDVELGMARASILAGASLWSPGRDTPAGRCTSAAACPGLAAAAGLAYLHRSVEVPATLAWTPAGVEGPGAGPDAFVEVRDLPLIA